MLKCHFPELKGSICNIPLDKNDIVNIVLHGTNSNE